MSRCHQVQDSRTVDKFQQYIVTGLQFLLKKSVVVQEDHSGTT